MRKFLVIAAVASLATLACGETLLDQIGANSNATNNQGVYASQEFEAAYAQYHIAVIDDFTVPAGGRSLNQIELVLGWWNATAFNIGAVTGYKVQIYSSTSAAGQNLTGNIWSGTVLLPRPATSTGARARSATRTTRSRFRSARRSSTPARTTWA